MDKFGETRWFTTVFLLFTLPTIAVADVRITYLCKGEQTTEGGDITPVTKPVMAYYTIELSNKSGRYFSWEDQQWRPIYAIKGHLMHLTNDNEMGHWWSLAIDRDTGAWDEAWVGGQSTTDVTGRCRKVPLREP